MEVLVGSAPAFVGASLVGFGIAEELAGERTLRSTPMGFLEKAVITTVFSFSTWGIWPVLTGSWGYREQTV
jgi:hypothetical protein